MPSEDAASMIFATGMAETGYRVLKQIKGPALGFFQMEPATCKDMWKNYIAYRPHYKSKLLALGFDENDMDFCITSNIALQIAFCRLHYRRVPSALPKAGDIEGQAKYWKNHYNSALGKGTHEHFIQANKG